MQSRLAGGVPDRFGSPESTEAEKLSTNGLHACVAELVELGATHLKAEFEAEGATGLEAQLLASVANEGGLGLVIKIGGCEAVRDIREALQLQAQSIVAPMIESPFAATKFERAASNEARAVGATLPQLAINIESVAGVAALPQIVQSSVSKRLDRLVVGRTDLSDSLGLDPRGVESELVEGHTRRVLEIAKEHGLATTVGGTITTISLGFIARLGALVDTVETRKVLFPAAIVTTHPERIEKAIRFERAWLRHKSAALGPLTMSEEVRLTALDMRLASSRSLR
jgi:4-hydroxy-2-oxoheptanedioate aldolase